jgi:hypothetical protein
MEDLLCDKEHAGDQRCASAVRELRDQLRRDSGAPAKAQPLLELLTPEMLQRLVALAERTPGDPGALTTASQRALVFESLCVLADHFGFARRIVEAGVLEACFAVLRSGDVRANHAEVVCHFTARLVSAATRSSADQTYMSANCLVAAALFTSLVCMFVFLDGMFRSIFSCGSVVVCILS